MPELALKAALRAGLAAKKSGRDGCYIDSCFVHQQSIGACWAQKDGAFPNCVGWTPNQPGAWRYHYWTAVESNSAPGVRLTPQEAFSRYVAEVDGGQDGFVLARWVRYTHNAPPWGVRAANPTGSREPPSLGFLKLLPLPFFSGTTQAAGRRWTRC